MHASQSNQKGKTCYNTKYAWHNHTYRWIHHPPLPNYMKTFDFQLANKPVQANFKLHIPDLNLYCFLCETTHENDIHLFSKCAEIKVLLHYVTRIYYNITKQHSTYFHQTIRIQSQIPPSNIPYDNDITHISTLFYCTLSGRQDY